MSEDLTWKWHTLYVEDISSATEIALQVRSWTTIRQVKKMIFDKTGLTPSQQRLCWQGRELKNGQTLASWINHDMSIRLQLFVSSHKPHTGFTIEAADDYDKSPTTTALIASVKRGLQDRWMPIKTDEFEGSGGVYFLTSSGGQRLAVFKPQDEEQGMPQNPKYYRGDGVTSFKPHFKAGDNCLREVAAYMLDVDRFAAVPVTTLVHCEHEVFSYPHNPYPQYYPKFGSLQEYVVADDVFENLGPKMFTTLSIQKIALLDLRILNCDRNSSNILVQREFSPSGPQYNLIPIDHGFCLPTWPYVCSFDWCWYDLPQVREPICPEIVDYMRSLDIEEVIASIRSRLSPPEASIFLLRVMHQLILAGIDAGLTLKDIADLVAREDDDAPASKLEVTLADAEDNTYRFFEMAQEGATANGVKSMNELRLFNTTFKQPPAMYRSHDPTTAGVLAAVQPTKTHADADGAYTEEKQSPAWLASSTTGIHANGSYAKLTRQNAMLPGSALPSSNGLAGAPLSRLSTVDTPAVPIRNLNVFRPAIASPLNGPRFSKVSPVLPKPPQLRIRRNKEHEDGREAESDNESDDSDLGTSPPGFWRDSPLEMHKIVQQRASQRDLSGYDEDATFRAAHNSLPGVELEGNGYGHFDELDEVEGPPSPMPPPRPVLKPEFHSDDTDHSRATAETDLLRTGQMRPALTRVVTFSAFDSPIEYDTENQSRRFNTLKQERRKFLAETQEFSDYKWQLLVDSVSNLAARTARLKQRAA